MPGLLEALGNVLDIPGSMIRDTISARNPFDQLMSPFSGEDRASGADVLHSWGMGPDHNILGTGLEFATDPLSLFGASLFGKAVPFNWWRTSTHASAGYEAGRS